MKKIENICVLGLGYIGLPTAAMAASKGFDVVGVDVNPSVVDTINKGRIHIEEPGLEQLVHAVVERRKLQARMEVVSSDVYMVAVPTPIHPDKSPDLSYVDSAVRSIAGVLEPGQLIVIESTIPPLTCSNFVGPLIKEITGLSWDKDYLLAHCPERVIPGAVLHEIVHNDRIIGGATAEAAERAAELYASFVVGKLLQTSITTAETVKLMENTFRDVNIALANEFAKIAEAVGIDIFEAIALANRHPRVNIHNPGIGVGGHCIPVVPWFLIHTVPQDTKIIQCARDINDAKPAEVALKILALLNQNAYRNVALFGLSFKPDVDDMRNSPAIEIARRVAEATGVEVKVVEPFAKHLPKELAARPNVKLVSSDEALAAADLKIGLVQHTQFKDLPLLKVI